MPLATDPWNCRNQTVNRAHSLETPLSPSRPYFPRSIVQIAAWLLLIGGIFAGGPAIAQFGGIFGDAPPPRPPADVPTGPFPAQPPPVGGYPEQAPQRPDQQPYPQQGQSSRTSSPIRDRVSSSRISNPIQLIPAKARRLIRASLRIRRSRGRSKPSRCRHRPALRSHPRPGRPRSDRWCRPHRHSVARLRPRPRIRRHPRPLRLPPRLRTTRWSRRRRRISTIGRAVFSGLDKITGRTTTFDAAIGETVQFGALQVTPRACYTRPATEATNTDAFVEVDEVTLQGDIKRIFTGWMFASSPGLHAVEHPIYDVWLMDCSAPVQTSQAEPAAPPAPPPAAKPVRRPPPRQQRPAARAPSAVEAQPR